MAVVNTKAANIAARDATPNTLDQRRVRTAYDGGPVAVAAADDDGSVYRVARAPSSARYYGVQITNSAITSGTDYDLGLYRTAKDGGAVVVKDCLVDGRTMASAVATPTGLPLTSYLSFGKRLWEIAGLAADPQCDFDICWTANTVGSADGTIVTQVETEVA